MPQEVRSVPEELSADVLAAAREEFAALFGGEHDPRTSPPSHLETPRARRWFGTVGWGAESGNYTYQYPIEGKSGAWVRVAGHDLLLASAYDYLGLVGHPAIERAAIAAVSNYGTGTAGVRLLTGTTELHRQLERRISDFKGVEAALTLTSGYLANVGLIPALVGRADRVLIDARAHRSLVDGCKLAGVPHEFFAHNDMDALESQLSVPGSKTTLVIVEGVYSMDGDLCPLPRLVELKKRFGAILLVDEAHSLGTLGATGRGIDEHFGVPPEEVDFWVGSLSKAIPSNGGYIAASAADVLYLQHEAAPFFFSSALCPAAAGAALAALDVIESEPWRVASAARNARRLRLGLQEMGFDTGASASPIVPVVFREEVQTWTAARALLDAGVWATAVVPPAVPRGKARLRLCATAGHSEEDIEHLLRVFGERLAEMCQKGA